MWAKLAPFGGHWAPLGQTASMLVVHRFHAGEQNTTLSISIIHRFHTGLSSGSDVSTPALDVKGSPLSRGRKVPAPARACPSGSCNEEVRTAENGQGPWTYRKCAFYFPASYRVAYPHGKAHDTVREPCWRPSTMLRTTTGEI